MAAFNVVRYRVKPGMEVQFLEAHQNIKPDFTGFRRGNLIKTGELSYCFVGEWNKASDSLDAEEQMVEWLNSFRDTLEDLGHGLGVTDPMNGDSVIEY